MSIHRLLFILAIVFIPHISQAQVAATMLKMQQEQGAQLRTFTLYLSDSRIANLDEQLQLSELYDRETKILYVLNHQQKNYRSFSLPKAKIYADALQEMFTKFEKQLEQLPESQRKEEAERLNQFFNGGNTDRLEKSQYDLLSKRGEFAGVACDWYEITEEQTFKGEACVANPNAIKNGMGLLEMLQTMNEIYDLVIGAVQGRLHLNIPNNPMAPLAKLGKIPLSIEQQTSGIAIQLQSLQEMVVDTDIFSLPENFTELKEEVNKVSTKPN